MGQVIYNQHKPVEVSWAGETERLLEGMRLSPDGAFILAGHFFLPYWSEDSGDSYVLSFTLPPDYDEQKHDLWIVAQKNVELWPGHISDVLEPVLEIRKKE